jgi:hypothetical protein
MADGLVLNVQQHGTLELNTEKPEKNEKNESFVPVARKKVTVSLACDGRNKATPLLHKSFFIIFI